MSLVYSGNFEMLAEVDNHGVTRLQAGIHSTDFDWKLEPGAEFQTPEALLVWSDEGLNGMSQTYHRLYQKRLVRGQWREKVRPILINNWEATYFDFTEEKLLTIADKAAECGIELFVLDDGWFGARTSDYAGLGDWTVNRDRLPNGIDGLAEKIEARGMKFGIWVELEMVNEDSDLYRAHPDWVLSVPGRRKSLGRSQCVLDFSRKDVIDNIYGQMEAILASGKVSYVKWDMNRSITECWSHALPADQQGEVFHRYILGLYDLYERLTAKFPHVLFESCASGGNRFDPGMLYYAPQTWASDNSDAVERQKIQYGTSMCYPVSSMGSHVSVVPNHQVNRMTPLHTRANTAYFGTFGYELDLNKLTEEEIAEVKEQVAFMKEYREILQFGTFYRLQSPFEGNVTVWMSVSADKKTAIVGWYRTLNRVNYRFERVKLAGLLPDALYENSCSGARCYGDELMNYGLITTDGTAGEPNAENGLTTDFDSRIYVLKAVE
jgi:alpha-galactosidase